MNNDYLFIEDLHVSACVGHTKQERSFPQTLKITIHLKLPLWKAGKKDQLKLSTDYSQIYSKIKKLFAFKKYSLLEAAAEDIATLAFEDNLTQEVLIWIRKSVFSDTKCVGVFIQRTR